jgi:parallel beta-helix repeat protein
MKWWWLRALWPLITVGAVITWASPAAAHGAAVFANIVNLTPNSFPGTYPNIQAALNRYPNSTEFIFGCGTYRFPVIGDSALSPTAGDLLIGTGSFDGAPTSPPCAIWKGSRVISSWKSGNDGKGHQYWYANVGAANAINRTHLKCQTTTAGTQHDVIAGCSYPQDLYFNGIPKFHTVNWNGGKLGAGNWYFDYSGAQGKGAGTVYVADNPSGIKVELGVTAQALLTRNPHVTVQNLTIEQFATPNQSGTLQPDGNNDHIANNYVAWNHGEGIKPRGSGSKVTGVTIEYNTASYNGESGINTGGKLGAVISPLITGNLIEYNNTDSVSFDEAGGTKFAADLGDIISNNTIRYNNGPGLWGDVDEGSAAYPVRYVDNLVSGNALDGIRYEISHYATIVGNTVTNNEIPGNQICVAAHVPKYVAWVDCCTGSGTGTCGSACALGDVGAAVGEIAIVESDHTTVGENCHGNTITSKCGAINIQSGNRLAPPATHMVVEYNNLTFSVDQLVEGLNGGQNNPGGQLFDGSSYFEHNTYTFDTKDGKNRNNFAWSNGSGGNAVTHWQGWQNKNQDSHGSAAP